MSLEAFSDYFTRISATSRSREALLSGLRALFGRGEIASVEIAIRRRERMPTIRKSEWSMPFINER